MLLRGVVLLRCVARLRSVLRLRGVFRLAGVARLRGVVLLAGVASVLNTFRVHTRCGALVGTSQRIALAAVIVDIFQVERVDVAREVAVKRY